MGRLKPRVDDAVVQVETEALVRQALPPEFDRSERGGLRRIDVAAGGRGLDSLRHTYARPLYLLMAIMAAILLIGCANIAGLMITRAAAREPEMAMRLALGAARGRLIRQLLTESMLLACAGSAAGIALALVVRDTLLPLLNQDADRIAISFGFDRWLVAFSAGLCLGVGVLCGILPALRATRRRHPVAQPVRDRDVVLAAGRQDADRDAGGALAPAHGRRRPVHADAREPAAAVARLPTRSPARVPDGREGQRLSGRPAPRLLRARARAGEPVPGVHSIALSRYGLLSGGATRDSIVVPGASQEVGVHLHFVSPRYFETMGIPLLAGRDLVAQDREGAPRVAVINEALSRLLGGGAAIGRRVAREKPVADIEVVGIASDARYTTLREPPPPTLYLPYRQSTRTA